MTWNDRRKGWFGRPPKRETIPDAIDEHIPISQVSIPQYPCFSPGSVAQILSTSRQTVRYWMVAGKLEFYRDNLDEPYILRSELVRFVRDYLNLPTLPE